ncbi:hypothetical protein FH972_022038 [Carpinus fangiana]|uniref:Major facilitator superfamily (MFS) profile domain-containing protein n=1 Tax=Carpinus fangiana TaxID=176857 RepID=A0A5N6KR26_9ROSI|nr:hypothetical protein FH972_022038 [Carpinus fangiana]
MSISGTSVNCIPWVYGPEILALHARVRGTAVGVSASWLWSFFAVMITPTIITKLQWKVYLIFKYLKRNLDFIGLLLPPGDQQLNARGNI